MVYSRRAGDFDQRVVLDETGISSIEAALSTAIDVTHRGTAETILVVADGSATDANLSTHGFTVGGSMVTLHNGHLATTIDTAFYFAC